VGKLWRATSISVYRNNERGLQATIDLAGIAQGAPSRRVQEEARTISAYCQNCLNDIRQGQAPKRNFSRLFHREPPEPVKTCPDCAEQVKAAAKICRFCRHEFD
jgi:hypothetical protein